MIRRAWWPWILLAPVLAGCGGAALPLRPTPPFSAVGARAADSPRRDLFPPTPSGIHLNLVFNYYVRHPQREIGVVDVVWGASSPNPRQVYNQFYTPFEREGSYAQLTHSLHWWQTHHRDWLEYRCDRTTVAWEFGDRRDVPLDIANPAFQQFQRSGAIDPALDAGYRGIDFDNLSLGNYSARCGHFDAAGGWVGQYDGNFTDPAYARDVIAWARSTYASVHAYSSSATMAINYSYQSSSSFEQNLTLMKQADEVLDERGFTNWGQKRHVTTPAEWRQIVVALRALQANKSCYVENGEEPPASRDITQAERLWVVSNYLLTRDACTYVWMSGFTARRAQQYGRLLVYPEYHLHVGAPAGEARREGLGWKRPYDSGLALVNPSSAPVTFRLYRPFYDENGNVRKGKLTLAATTGEILLTAPP